LIWKARNDLILNHAGFDWERLWEEAKILFSHGEFLELILKDLTTI
jgi:hypothetical protein